MATRSSPDRWLSRRSGRARLEALGGGLAGLFGACAYSSFLLEKALGSPLNPAHAYVSELGASSQPAAAFFRVSDVLAGAGFIVFAWPAFWWLDHYAGLHRHLRAHFRCVLENDRLVVFDLRP
jgi:hypothetical protein